MKKPLSEQIVYDNTTSNSAQYQSMHTKGAENSFHIARDLLESIGEDIEDGIPSGLYMRLFEMNSRERVRIAKRFFRSVQSDLGKPDDTGTFVSHGTFNDIFPITSIERYPSWRASRKKSIAFFLHYLDTHLPPKELTDRPALALIKSYSFTLKKQRVNTKRSQIEISVSPESNTLGLTLFTPCVNAEELGIFREKLQTICPIELKDRYFYVEKTYSDNSVTRQRLFRQ